MLVFSLSLVASAIAGPVTVAETLATSLQEDGYRCQEEQCKNGAHVLGRPKYHGGQYRQRFRKPVATGCSTLVTHVRSIWFSIDVLTPTRVA
jgi:hypothetical protein